MHFKFYVLFSDLLPSTFILKVLKRKNDLQMNNGKQQVIAAGCTESMCFRRLVRDWSIVDLITEFT